MSNKVYDVLKYIVQFALPAIGALYSALATIWALPYQSEITATCVALAMFGSTMLGISNTTYKLSNKEAKKNDSSTAGIYYVDSNIRQQV